MNRLMKTATAIVASLAMIAAPAAEAQGRGRQAHTSQQQSAPSRGPGSSNGNRPGGSHSSNGNRPGNNGNRPGNNGGVQNRPVQTRPPQTQMRPGNSSNNKHQFQGNMTRPGNNNGNNRPGNDNGYRPGNNNRPGNSNGFRPGGNHGNRPGNGDMNRPGGNRPGGNRPGNDNGFRPGGNRPGDRPGGPAYGHHRPPRPPMPPRVPHGYRHPVPFFGHYSRPVPPPRFSGYFGPGPSFGTILGVALGTALDISINSLLNSGYTITNYGNDVVYLTGVPQMNMVWPNAALYYSNGRLCGSQFTYPSNYYDMTRYNMLYSQLCSQYGAPLESYNRGGIISSTWFGVGNRFVTLEFNPLSGQYYTTLSFGN